MQHTLGTASKATGKSKSTILRALKRGVISGSRDENTNDWQIDASELHRVYKPNGMNGHRNGESNVTQQSETSLRAELEGVKAVNEVLRDQVADLKSDRDAWKGQAEAIKMLVYAPRSSLRWWQRFAKA